MTLFSLPGVRNAPLDIWGRLEFLLVANFFFTSARKLFFVMNVRQLFSGQHIFHQFRQQTFFSDHIFNKLFFLLPPSPQISNGAPLRWLSMSTRLFPPPTLIDRPIPIECDAGVTMWRCIESASSLPGKTLILCALVTLVGQHHPPHG